MSRGLHSPPYKKLRLLLTEARARAGLTQLQVAERVKRPQSYVSKYENGERQLDVIEFIAICAAMNVHPCSLVEQLV
ncbi:MULTISPECIES: helix-turn-helix transcriptional regulator [unclassified Variovorax]|jgi:transcriptional regulator with XRE-family HTH domain|uniref:helix-turn-helix domain-containing protein n=1 Tax=unclassified Variovorax TaxID=663243 RepID=UPI000B827FD5|nr:MULTISPECIES: helix-turn-helix transcriptional regulator [unclassified Variovorax]